MALRKKKITLDDIDDNTLYSIATKLYYYFYLCDYDYFFLNQQQCINNVRYMFEKSGINIRDLTQVDQYFASGFDLDEMENEFIVVDPGRSYQFEVNYLIHHEQKRWEKWHL